MDVEVTETAPAQAATGAGPRSEPRREGETSARRLDLGLLPSYGKGGGGGRRRGVPVAGAQGVGCTLCHPCADPGAGARGAVGLTPGLPRGLKDYLVNNLL